MKQILVALVVVLAAALGYYILNPQPPAAASTIQVINATYGGNCNLSANGNQTYLVKDTCEGKSNCGYVLTTSPGGDPCNQVQKEFTVVWTCSGQSGQQRGRIPAEAIGQSISLSCP